MDIHAAVTELEEELIALRRDFHRKPELGFEETRTRDAVIAYLGELGLEVHQMGGTGVTALLRGAQPGKTVLLRADMDALPVKEETGLSFASQEEGKMHACGHDGHMAMLLAAAKVLTRMRAELKGNVKFVFQPNEEDAGAYAMLDAGVMSDPKVDAVFGLHLWSQLPSGVIDIVDGPHMAASHYFFLTVRGKGGHAGFAHESIDPIYAATNLVQSIQAVQTREINALDPAVLMVTEFHAGSNMTTVPDAVEIKGSIRFLYEGGEEVIERFERIVQHTCAAHRVEYDLRYKVGNRLLSNDPRVAALARSAAEETLGDSEKVTSGLRTMAGDDFSDYLQEAPGAYAFLGINNPEVGADYPHHHPRFTIDEAVLPKGAELHVRTALKLLESDVSGK
jgi:amidohydrolase